MVADFLNHPTSRASNLQQTATTLSATPAAWLLGCLAVQHLLFMASKPSKPVAASKPSVCVQFGVVKPVKPEHIRNAEAFAGLAVFIVGQLRAVLSACLVAADVFSKRVSTAPVISILSIPVVTLSSGSQASPASQASSASPASPASQANLTTQESMHLFGARRHLTLTISWWCENNVVSIDDQLVMTVINNQPIFDYIRSLDMTRNGWMPGLAYIFDRHGVLASHQKQQFDDALKNLAVYQANLMRVRKLSKTTASRVTAWLDAKQKIVSSRVVQTSSEAVMKLLADLMPALAVAPYSDQLDKSVTSMLVCCCCCCCCGCCCSQFYDNDTMTQWWYVCLFGRNYLPRNKFDRCLATTWSLLKSCLQPGQLCCKCTNWPASWTNPAAEQLMATCWQPRQVGFVDIVGLVWFGLVWFGLVWFCNWCLGLLGWIGLLGIHLGALQRHCSSSPRR